MLKLITPSYPLITVDGRGSLEVSGGEVGLGSSVFGVVHDFENFVASDWTEYPVAQGFYIRDQSAAGLPVPFPSPTKGLSAPQAIGSGTGNGLMWTFTRNGSEAQDLEIEGFLGGNGSNSWLPGVCFRHDGAGQGYCVFMQDNGAADWRLFIVHFDGAGTRTIMASVVGLTQPASGYIELRVNCTGTGAGIVITVERWTGAAWNLELTHSPGVGLRLDTTSTLGAMINGTQNGVRISLVDNLIFRKL